jgi:hypothetical protein
MAYPMIEVLRLHDPVSSTGQVECELVRRPGKINIRHQGMHQPVCGHAVFFHDELSQTEHIFQFRIA